MIPRVAPSQTGRETELSTWTQTAHAAGYKVMAYNNPYVAANDDGAAADYAYGLAHGYFVEEPDGTPVSAGTCSSSRRDGHVEHVEHHRSSATRRRSHQSGKLLARGK